MRVGEWRYKGYFTHTHRFFSPSTILISNRGALFSTFVPPTFFSMIWLTDRYCFLIFRRSFVSVVSCILLVYGRSQLARIWSLFLWCGLSHSFLLALSISGMDKHLFQVNIFAAFPKTMFSVSPIRRWLFMVYHLTFLLSPTFKCIGSYVDEQQRQTSSYRRGLVIENGMFLSFVAWL
jgi:hypothetical protein